MLFCYFVVIFIFSVIAMNIVGDNAERGEAACKMRFKEFSMRNRNYSSEKYIAVSFPFSKTRIFGHFIGISIIWEHLILHLIKIREHIQSQKKNKRKENGSDFYIFGDQNGNKLTNLTNRIRSVFRFCSVDIMNWRFHDLKKVASKDTAISTILNTTCNNISELMAPARTAMNHSAY